MYCASCHRQRNPIPSLERYRLVRFHTKFFMEHLDLTPDSPFYTFVLISSALTFVVLLHPPPACTLSGLLMLKAFVMKVDVMYGSVDE